MNSSTSSSDDRAWKRFFWKTFGWAVGLGVLVFVWILVIDPYDAFHLSPDLDRAPLAHDGRPWFHAVARAPQFDSAIVGTSTSRLLKPSGLNAAFDARFVNLSMNEATEHEQRRVFDVFRRHHRDIKVVIIGAGRYWCIESDELKKYAGYVFPEHLYDDEPWNDYREMFSIRALRDSIKQFATIVGGRKRRWGRDGYRNFAEGTVYDLEKARKNIYGARTYDPTPVSDPVRLDDAERAALRFASHPLLEEMLAGLPDTTVKVIYFVPLHAAEQPRPGTRLAAVLDESKRRIAAIVAKAPNGHCIDFLIPTALTRTDSNYWDGVHYTVEIADKLSVWLGEAARGVKNDDVYRILAP